MTSTFSPRRKVRWLPITAAIALMASALVICGALGWWQWTRSHAQSVAVTPEATVPIADVLAPASSPGTAISRQVTVGGTWADADSVIIDGREIEGTPAELLVRPLIVDAGLTGTGEPATLAVIVGWRPAGDLVGPDPEPGGVEFDGYLRSAEQSTAASDLPSGEVEGATWGASMSVAELAQVWPGPMYSALMVSYEGSPSWEPLPPLPPESSINIQSLAYSFEWWIFGAFAVFLGVRWIRDNGFTSSDDDAVADGPSAPDGQVASDENVAGGDAVTRKDQS